MSELPRPATTPTISNLISVLILVAIALGVGLGVGVYVSHVVGRVAPKSPVLRIVGVSAVYDPGTKAIYVAFKGYNPGPGAVRIEGVSVVASVNPTSLCTVCVTLGFTCPAQPTCSLASHFLGLCVYICPGASCPFNALSSKPVPCSSLGENVGVDVTMAKYPTTIYPGVYFKGLIQGRINIEETPNDVLVIVFYETPEGHKEIATASGYVTSAP